MPHGICQICGGLHHHALDASPIDVKSKLAALHARVGDAELHCQTPRRGRATAEGAAPARGSEQIIIGGIEVTGKGSDSNTRSVTLEINPGQAVALEERKFSNAGDTSGKYEAGQAVTGAECRSADIGDTVAKREARQAVALIKRTFSNAGRSITNLNSGQAFAVIECSGFDIDDSVANNHIGQLLTFFENIACHVGDAVRNRDAGQSGRSKRIVSDAGYAIRNC